MRGRLLTVGLAAVVASLALTGCTTQGAPAPTYTPSAAPTVPGEEAPASPTHKPGEPAEANLPYFDEVNSRLFAEQGMADGRVIVDTLAAAGFDKAAMEVGYDSTEIGLDVDTINFSVKIGEECLVGQFVPAAYTGAVTSVLGSGTCLVGQTRPIDW